MIMMITAASGAVGEAHVPPCSVLVQFRRPKLYGHYSGTERCTRCATATSQSVWTAQPSFGFCASCAFSRGYTWGLTGDGPTQSTGGPQRQPHQNQRRRRRRRHSQRTATPLQHPTVATAAASRSAPLHYRYRVGDVVTYHRSNGHMESVTVMCVHRDSGCEPYYTIRTGNGRERQTVASRLGPLPSTSQQPMNQGRVQRNTHDSASLQRGIRRRAQVARQQHDAAMTRAAAPDLSRSGHDVNAAHHEAGRGGVAVPPTQEQIDFCVQHFRDALGDESFSLRCCCVCHEAQFPDDVVHTMTARKFLALKAVAGDNVLQEPRFEETDGAQAGPSHVCAHDYTGATLHVRAGEYTQGASGTEWARNNFGDNWQEAMPDHFRATVERRCSDDITHPDFYRYDIVTHGINENDPDVRDTKVDVNWIARRVATVPLSNGHETQSDDDSHPLIRNCGIDLRSQYDITIHPSSKRLVERYVSSTPRNDTRERRQRQIEAVQLASLMLGYGGVSTRSSATGNFNSRSWQHQLLLHVCDGCHTSLRRGRLPRLSIANGFAIGWLPPALARLSPSMMEWALAQPVHSFSYLFTYCCNKDYNGGRLVQSSKVPHTIGPQAMRGHLHAKELDAPFVAKSMPHGRDIPVRALIDFKSADVQQHATQLRQFQSRFAHVRRSMVCALVDHGIAHNRTAYGAYKSVDEDKARELPVSSIQPPGLVDLLDRSADCIDDTELTDSDDTESESKSQERYDVINSNDAEDEAQLLDSDSESDFESRYNGNVTANAAPVAHISGVASAPETQNGTQVTLLSSTMTILPVGMNTCDSRDVRAAVLADAALSQQRCGGAVAVNMDPLVDSDDSGVDDQGAGHDTPAHSGLMHVRTDSRRVNYWDTGFFEKSFVWCFPWGRGGPSEVRRVSVSLEKCIAHYVRLRWHSEFRRTEFALPAYNVCARRAASSTAYLSGRSARGASTCAAAFNRIDPTHLTKLADHFDRCHDARKRSAPRPEPPPGLVMNGIDAKFLRTVEYVHPTTPLQPPTHTSIACPCNPHVHLLSAHFCSCIQRTQLQCAFPRSAVWKPGISVRACRTATAGWLKRARRHTHTASSLESRLSLSPFRSSTAHASKSSGCPTRTARM